MITTKKAEIGGSQDQPFEQSFASLAHAYLRDKAPGLIEYEVGFQLIDRNQENTKAIGCFGFQVGSQWLYAPVFFLNGDLKGHELLYIKHQDVFVPMKENWLNYILNRKPHVLGKEVDRNLSRLGVTQPNMYQISRSPHKFASVAKWPAWIQPFMPDLGELVTGNPISDTKYASCPSLPSLIKTGGERMLRALLATISDFPKLAGFIDQYHGLSFIDEEVKKIAEKKASERSKTILDGAVTAVAKEAKKKRKSKNAINVHVITDEKWVNGSSDITLSDDDRKMLASARILIKDERTDDETSIAYNVQTKISLTNPDETGVYDILTRSPHKYERCLVVKAPYAKKGPNTFCTVVKLEGEGSKSYLNIHPSNVWSRQVLAGKGYWDWFKKLEDADSLSVGSTYVIVTEHGEGTVPFEVEGELSNEDGVKTYDVWFRSYGQTDRPSFLPTIDRSRYISADFECDYGYYAGNKICLTGKEGSKVQNRGGVLYIPKGAKLVKIKESKKDEASMGGCCSPCHSEPSPIEPGNLLDAQLMVFSKMAKLEVRSNGSTYSMNGSGEVPFNDALVDLVTSKGLREKQARTILEESAKNKKMDYFLKLASPYLTSSGPNAPLPPDNYGSNGGDGSWGGGMYPTQQMQEYNVDVPDMSAANTDRSIYDPTQNVNPWDQIGNKQDTMNTAMNAAQSGQKEVFDTAMLGSLLKATRDDSMVDKYMGDLMKGMDRLGRILFLFYWHQDSFSERYGKGDLPELEDSLRNAFEGVGDIVLFLKQRTVDPNPEDVGGRIDLDAIANS